MLQWKSWYTYTLYICAGTEDLLSQIASLHQVFWQWLSNFPPNNSTSHPSVETRAVSYLCQWKVCGNTIIKLLGFVAAVFISGCVGSLLHRRFSSCVQWGLLSSRGAWAAHGWPLPLLSAALDTQASTVAAHGLSGCGSWAQGTGSLVVWGMCDLPGSGIKPWLHRHPILNHQGSHQESPFIKFLL